MFPKTRIKIPSPLVAERNMRTVSVHWKKLLSNKNIEEDLSNEVTSV